MQNKTMKNNLQNSATIRKWALITYWITMFVATHWPDIDRYKPETGWPIPRFEMVMHSGVYAGWVIMWWWLLSTGGRRLNISQIKWLIIGGGMYSLFDELTQAIVSRTPSLTDFLFNMLGITITVLALNLLQKSKLYD